MKWLLSSLVVLFMGLKAPLFSENSQTSGKAKDGLVVVLGCENSDASRPFAAEKCLLQFLDRDSENVASTKKRIDSQKMSKTVTTRVFDGKTIPFPDDTVNRLIVNNPFDLEQEEMRRVVAPGGVIERGGQQWRKPWPEEIDEWGQYFHDAANTGVSTDTRVGPPRKILWIVDPLMTRSHDTIRSFAAVVSAKGRVFSVEDRYAHMNDQRLPQKWRLRCRDAFNGALLWEKDLPNWLWPNSTRPGFGYSRGSGYAQNHPQSFLTDGDHLFLFTGKPWRLTVLNAATGQLVKEFTDIKGVGELVYADQKLLVATRPPKDDDGDSKNVFLDAPVLRSINTESITPKWSVPAPGFQFETLTMHDGRVFYEADDNIVALDAETGKKLWNAPLPVSPPKRSLWKARVLVGCDNYLLAASGNQKIRPFGTTLGAYDTATGKLLWTQNSGGGRTGHFPINGKIYSAFDIFDVKTGKSLGKVDTKGLFTPGHHLRCYAWQATPDFLITNNRGCEFVPINKNVKGARNDYLRSTCRLGGIPANGLLYVTPNTCFCYDGVMQHGYKGLAPGETKPITKEEAMDPGRLEKGPAYSRTVATSANSSLLAQNSELAKSSDWPMYRGNTKRLGASSQKMSNSLEKAWNTAVGGKLTPPVLANGVIYAAQKNSHNVLALDADNGNERWRFQADARVDSPPSLYKGRLIFGCADGFVYCLDANSGDLAWRFRAAPRERWINSFGQLESVWPVHGSVLIEDGVAYFTAGRNTWFDGGIHAYGLDAVTGKPLYYQLLKDEATAPGVEAPPEPAEAFTLSKEQCLEEGFFDPYTPAYHVEGARSTLLVSDGENLYLGPIMLDRKLNPVAAPYFPDDIEYPKAVELTGAPFVDQSIFKLKSEEAWKTSGLLKGRLGEKKTGLHLSTTGGFLSENSHERHYWMYARRWPGHHHGQLASKTGQILVADDQNTYGVQIFNSRKTYHTPRVSDKGVLIFADDNDSEPVLDPKDKNRLMGLGYVRPAPPKWHHWEKINARAMTATSDKVFVLGTELNKRQNDPYAPYEGRTPTVLLVYDKKSGEKLSEQKLDAAPMFDSLIAGNGNLYYTTKNGNIICLKNKKGDSRP